MKLEDIRRQYIGKGLTRENLMENPIEQFEIWMQHAIEAGLKDPTAMTLGTVDADGAPSQRIVLLKHMDAEGFVFFTNYSSRKAVHIESNNAVCLHFPWHDMERQVMVQGVAQRVSYTESLSYFLSRPKESQLAAWASKQSRGIPSRQFLMQQFQSMKEKFSQGDIPLPDFWGGYRVVPDVIEFWQGQENRLHDRFEYRRIGPNWQVERLSP